MIELNIFKIGQVMAILSSKKGFKNLFQLSRKFWLVRENSYNSANFKDNPKFFSLHVLVVLSELSSRLHQTSANIITKLVNLSHFIY